jgi:hypothetical protein
MMTDDNDFKLKICLINENIFLKEQNSRLLEEMKNLKERLKKYTCPKRNKVYYEKNKDKIIKQNSEYRKNKNNTI